MNIFFEIYRVIYDFSRDSKKIEKIGISVITYCLPYASVAATYPAAVPMTSSPL